MRKITAQKALAQQYYVGLKQHQKKLVNGSDLPVCSMCGSELVMFQEKTFCRSCEAYILLEAARSYVASLERDPEYRDTIEEMSQAFRDLYSEALEKLELYEFEYNNVVRPISFKGSKEKPDTSKWYEDFLRRHKDIVFINQNAIKAMVGTK